MTAVDHSGQHGRHQLRATWLRSDRFLPRTVVRPVLRFMDVEAAAGVVMLVAAVAGLLWANLPWHLGYEQLWNTPVHLQVGSVVDLDLTLREWVNNAAMALFFLLAGLEIKRQLLRGELRTPRAAALPIVAALGGMLVPALLYTLINHGTPGAPGWGIPVATDIAFAVGIVTLAGDRIPLGAKIFILTLAVADDVGGIVVIAIFYAKHVDLAWLALAVVAAAVAYLCQRADIRSFVPYVALGALCWLGLQEAGVEAAIVGVVFGLLTPISPFHDPATFGPPARQMVDRIEATYADGVLTEDERDSNESDLMALSRFAAESESPLERLEVRLGLWVSLLVVPLFAFANAGVRIVGGGPLDGRVLAGVVVGLVVGKTVGVFTASWLMVRLGFGRLPAGASWSTMFGLAVTAGIGFTVALFVTTLSFTDPVLTSSAKVGVLLASTIAGIFGLLALRRARPAPVEPAAPEAALAPQPSA